MKVNGNYSFINAAAQEKDANSTLNYFRKMVALRKSSPALIYGAYKLYDAADTKIYSYTRTESNEKLLVVMNFSNDMVDYFLTDDLKTFVVANPLINNYPDLAIDKKMNSIHLQPWQAVVLKQ